MCVSMCSLADVCNRVRVRVYGNVMKAVLKGLR